MSSFEPGGFDYEVSSYQPGRRGGDSSGFSGSGGGYSSSYGFGGSGNLMGEKYDMPSGSMDALGGGFSTTDGSGSAEKTKKSNSQTVIPVSIKQLLTAQFDEDNAKIDGVEIHIVRICGHVVSSTEQSTSLIYQINDGSGTIECKLWLDKEKAPKNPSCREGSCVKIHGVIRQYEGKAHVMIYRMVPLYDYNELTHHMLEIIYVHLALTKGPLQGSQGSTPMVLGTPQWKGMASQSTTTSVPNRIHPVSYASPANSSKTVSNAGQMTANNRQLQLMVWDFFVENSNPGQQHSAASVSRNTGVTDQITRDIIEMLLHIGYVGYGDNSDLFVTLQKNGRL